MSAKMAPEALVAAWVAGNDYTQNAPTQLAERATRSCGKSLVNVAREVGVR